MTLRMSKAEKERIEKLKLSPPPDLEPMTIEQEAALPSNKLTERMMTHFNIVSRENEEAYKLMEKERADAKSKRQVELQKDLEAFDKMAGSHLEKANQG